MNFEHGNTTHLVSPLFHRNEVLRTGRQVSRFLIVRSIVLSNVLLARTSSLSLVLALQNITKCMTNIGYKCMTNIGSRDHESLYAQALCPASTTRWF